MQINRLTKQSKLIFLIGWLLALPACLPVNYKPYRQLKYYHKTKAAIQQLPASLSQPDTVRAGWAKVNITPLHKVPLAGYGKRKGKRLQAIHDSIYVRAFVFQNKTQKVAFVSMDLLIVPMAVTKALTNQLPEINFSINQTYLTATHTHSSLGGWARKPAGYLMAGNYSQEIVNSITQAIVRAIREAALQAAPAQLGFVAVPADAFVGNRLVGAQGTRDAFLRLLKIKKTTGEIALLVTYAAHATCLPAAELSLSGDYPAALVQLLEKHPDLDFAAFSAGAVGSHSPAATGEHFEKATNMAQGLSRLISQHLQYIPLSYTFHLNAVSVPVYLRKPHWRIAQNWRLHPAFFYLIFGKYPAALSGLRLGNILFVGIPGDFSGELVADLEKQITAVENSKLVITSFNGGYITPDKYYSLKKYETRDMNLFGPYNGAYISEMIQLLLPKL